MYFHPFIQDGAFPFGNLKGNLFQFAMDAVRWLAEILQTLKRGQDFKARYPETVPVVNEINQDVFRQFTYYKNATETMVAVVLISVRLQYAIVAQATRIVMGI